MSSFREVMLTYTLLTLVSVLLYGSWSVEGLGYFCVGEVRPLGYAFLEALDLNMAPILSHLIPSQSLNYIVYR